jgi:hypothetical protein
MFVLVTLVALVVAWFVWQIGLVRERQSLVRHIVDHGGSVYLGSELRPDQRAGGLSAFRQWMGDEPVARIYLPPPDFSAADFAGVRAAFPEAAIWPAEPVAVR